MTTLRVVLDPLVGPPSSGGRYAERLTRALTVHAPSGSGVTGVISSIDDDAAAAVETSLSGLRGLHRTRLGRRELRAAWQHGITVVPGVGLLHATDPVAPLGRHDRRADPDSQVVVTIHDTTAWTHRESLDPREGSRRRALGARAVRFADAIVVPTHAVASVVAEELGVGDRVRVIAAAPRPGARITPDDDRGGPELPGSYVIAVLPDAADGWHETAMEVAAALPDGTRLVVVTSPAFGATTEDAGALERVTVVESPPDSALAGLLEGASALVELAPEIGFGLSALEAMSLGLPVVHVRGEDAQEILADAGVAVDRTSDLGAATRELLEDPAARERHSTLGRDRAGAFSWRDSAEKVWQLHADL